MDFDHILSDLGTRLSKKRFIHTEGVAKTARKLAEKYGVNPDKAELAGWIHDCMKQEKLSFMQELIQNKKLAIPGFSVDNYMLGSKNLLHGPAGAVFADTYYEIHDISILSAVACHTTGKAHMSLLEKVIFLADYIEPSRDFPGVEEIRAEAKKDLDWACIVAYDSTISHLAKEHEYLHPLTIEGRNELVESWEFSHKDKQEE